MKKSISILVIVTSAIIGGIFGSTIVKSFFQKEDSASFDQVLVETSKKINATLPMQVDKETRLDSTIAGPGNRLTYFYTLVGLSSDGLDPARLTEMMKPRLINGYKTSPDMAALRERQVELNYHYRDKNGNTITTIVVSPKDF